MAVSMHARGQAAGRLAFSWLHTGIVKRWAYRTLIFVCSAGSCNAANPPDPSEFFEKRIRPVLVERCYECHSAESKKLKDGLLLDSRQGLLKGGESGKPALVPNEVERSRLIEAIRYNNADLQMPPKTKLPGAVIADFETWVRLGAFDPRTNAPSTPNSKQHLSSRDHWAFQAPQERSVPAVRDTAWPQSAIDQFILQRLEANGLRPSPPADKRTLIRRATYDLTGLPPTLKEVADFEKDSAPDALAKLVDRLLASPRYGERWGRHWLDVARYADTKGYVYYYEESRFVHPHAYRDWVIRAFNEDLPYDRFLLLQIAGDQILAASQNGSDSSGASTLRWPTPVYDPSVAALGFLTLGRRFLDLAPDIIDDQIDVLMRGTQALTVGCARCHDHKFDPIPTRDYYSLYGVFQGSEERIVALEPPPEPNQLMEFSRARAYIEFERGLRERLDKLESKFKAACDEVADRLRQRTKDYLVAVLDVAKLPSDANVRPQPEDINPFNVRQWERYLAGRTNDMDALFAPWHAFSRLEPDKFSEQAAAVARDLCGKTRGKLNPLVAQLFATAPGSMVEVAERYGDLLSRIHQNWQSSLTNAAKAKAKLQQLDNPDEESLRQVLYGPEAPVLVPPGRIVELDVHLYFDDPNRVALATLQMQLEQWIVTNAAAPLHAVVLRDRKEQVMPVIFRRGDPLKPGERVPRQFLEIVGGPSRQPFKEGSGRLELARAIASPENPLTARVIVNRVWAHHFGEGLVRTPSDFGTRSEPPSHPELLDWLARRFVADGWSIKKLHRLLMNSAVYQQESSVQSSVASHQSASTDGPSLVTERSRAAEVDPENRLLWRFNPQRLDFECLRDSLLAVTGELDTRMGGPAVELHQAPFSKRRTIYGKIDRKFLPGMFRVFDFANPDVHAPQRHATTMPQQALFLLNHAFMVERSRALAAKLQAIPVGDVETRIRHLYELALQRRPTHAQQHQAQEFLQEALEGQRANGPSGTSQTVESSHLLNAWEQLAQVMLLSNEFMFVD